MSTVMGAIYIYIYIYIYIKAKGIYEKEFVYLFYIII